MKTLVIGCLTFMAVALGTSEASATSLIGTTVGVNIVYDPGGPVVGAPVNLPFNASVLVVAGTEVSTFVSETAHFGGFDQVFSGTVTVDIGADTIFVGFNGTAQVFDLKF